MLEATQAPSTSCIAVKVTAGSCSSAIGALERVMREQCLRVRTGAAPERGKANAALIALLAKSPAGEIP